MAAQPLTPAAQRRLLRDLVTDLSQRQQERLEALIELMDEQRLIRLDRALDVATTPGDDDKRRAVPAGAALDGAATGRSTCILSSMAAGLQRRFCWFGAPHPDRRATENRVPRLTAPHWTRSSRPPPGRRRAPGCDHSSPRSRRRPSSTISFAACGRRSGVRVAGVAVTSSGECSG